MLNEAERTFKEGQKLVPDDYQFPLNLARVAIDRDDMKKAGKLLDESLELAGDNPKAYVFVIDCWAVAEELDKARAVLERAQRELTLTVDFYIELAGVLLSHNMQPPPMFGPPEPPKPVEGPWLTLAQEAVDQAVALKPDDPRVRYQLTVELLPYNPEMALEHAQAGADMSPDDPGGLFLLGFVQGINEMDKEAKATLRSVARMARKQGKHDLAEQADAVRQQVGSPFFRLSLQMGMMGGFDDMDEGDPFF
jgi:Flp pilus assembly protein TadD